MSKTAFTLKIAAVSIALAFGANAYAFDLKAPSIGSSSSSSAPTENANDVVRNARNSLGAFVRAKLGLIDAMGGSEQLDAQKKLIDGLKLGDAAASKEDLETIVSVDKATTEMINQKVSDNTKLDAKNKATAGKAMVDYVAGLVSAKKMIGSVQNLSKNPMSLGSSVGSITYLAKELPGVVSSGTSTTSTLFKYLGGNGVDLSNAKKAASDLGM